MAEEAEHQDDDTVNEADSAPATRAGAKRKSDPGAAKPADATGKDAPPAEADTGSEAGKGFADPLAAMAADLEAAKTENSEINDRLLRTVAEMENLRKRTQKDLADARAYSIASFAQDMLNVSDNLRRAVEAVPKSEDGETTDPVLKSLLEGVQMTERELINRLDKHGVREISPAGERFDPHFHQAMFEVQNPELPHNTVCEVIQAGFVIGERVLRPAMVGVAKGGPKNAAGKAEGGGDEAPADTNAD